MKYVDSSCLELLSPPQGAAINSSRAWSSEPRGSRSSQLILEMLMLLMCAGAVTGNTLVIIAVAATKTFHSVTSVLIMNLAISDLLVGLGVMPFVAVSVLNREWMNCTVLCLYVGYTSSVYCTASVLTLAAIALDRYHSIINWSSQCTRWRTYVVVLWIWLQALATSIPPLLGWSSISYIAPMFSCAVDWSASPSYTTLMAALSFFTPAVIIVICYVKIIRVARSHARRINSLESSVHHSSNPSSGFSGRSSHQQHSGSLPTTSTLISHISGGFDSSVATEERGYTTRSLPQSISQGPLQNFQQHNKGMLCLFVAISAFFLCWTPYVVVALVQAAEAAVTGQSSLVPSSIVTFSYWLLLLNSDINPLLYALFSKRFQNALQELGHKISASLKVEEVITSSRTSIQSEQLDSSDSLTSETSTKCSSYIFTISTPGFKHQTQSFSSNSYFPTTPMRLLDFNNPDIPQIAKRGQ